MKEHDIYIGTMLDELNLRFAPSQGKNSHFGGILEMVDLQKEFKIFKKGRSFKTSCAVLNLGARNNEVKNLWQNLLGNLHRHGSNQKGVDGDAAIVGALIKNLASKTPLPVFFTSHDMRGDKANTEVKIIAKSQPIHYLEQDFITISIPMQPISAAKKAAAKKPAAKK
ncbi:hypothetical protein [Polaromonas sp. YR568]|uniref:hypothetical protein n=1 Tax=Polaromonas sp. YR568 TaxID=1855301 RepID=UPI0011141700|nr:hypothetical protein [Polaromonas sp. YR568]